MKSVNQGAESLIFELNSKLTVLGIHHRILSNGANVYNFTNSNLDGGIFLAKICMGNLSTISLAPMKASINAQSGTIELDMIEVDTFHPIVSCMGAQYAGWNVKVKKINKKGEKKTVFKSLGSGPARALSRVEKELYEKIEYTDEHDAAVILFETSNPPDEDVAEYIAEKCKVDVSKVYLLYAPTASIAGSVQIAARIVETAIHKLMELGINPTWIKHGKGMVPIAPVAKDDMIAMGWTNDCIIFCGNVTLCVEVPEKEESVLVDLLKSCPSNTSSTYGKPFAQIFKDVDGDFYKIDPGMFAPAKITVINKFTDKFFIEGELAPEKLSFL